MKKTFWAAAAVLIVLILAFFLAVPPLVESALNRVSASAASVASAKAQELHHSLRIVDLHADSLLWGRDLLKRGGRGEVDVPRRIEGNVTLQVFTAVTKSPWGLNYERNDANSDTIFWLARTEQHLAARAERKVVAMAKGK